MEMLSSLEYQQWLSRLMIPKQIFFVSYLIEKTFDILHFISSF